MISTLTEADLHEAWQVEQASQLFPWRYTLFKDNVGERYVNLKRHDGALLQGFLISQWVADESALFNLAVHPNWRRHGYARELISQWITRMDNLQVATLWLEVRITNQAAITLYQQFGFNEVTVRKNYYPTQQGREDALVMGLYL